MTENNSMQQRRTIVWDLETTGFVDTPGSKIIEIAAMVFEGPEMKLIGEHTWLLNHNVEIPEKITEITGITKKMIDESGREAIICLREFTDLLVSVIRGGGTHVTHNGYKFDIPFLVKQHADFQVMDAEYQKEFREMLERSMSDTAVIFKGKKLGYQIQVNEYFPGYANRVMNTRVAGLKFNLGVCCDELGISREGIQQHRALADVYLTSEVYKRIG